MISVKQSTVCLCCAIQAVGEIPEEHRQGPDPMEVDPPTTNANGDAAPAAQKPWKKRGLRALNHPHLQPPDHMEVLQTVSNGLPTDWDLWDTIVEEALVYDSLPLGI